MFSVQNLSRKENDKKRKKTMRKCIVKLRNVCKSVSYFGEVDIHGSRNVFNVI